MRPTLRPYQLRALAEIRKAYKAGHRRILLVSPTGSGKTVMAGGIAHSFIAKTPNAKVAALVHRQELEEQMYQTLGAGTEEKPGFGLQVGYRGIGVSLPVQVAMTQGALARGTVPEADLVLPDECHHYCGTEQWSRVLQAYGPKTLVIGLTATPERADGAALDFFTHLIEVTTTKEMVDLWLETEGKEGLVPVETYRPSAPEKAGTLAKTPTEAYLSNGLRGRKAVVFAASVADAERFETEFSGAGVRAATIHGKLAKDERDKRLAGDWDVLCNVMVLTEGWDYPAVSVIILASRCGSYSGLVQRVGRGRRPFPGKQVCTILDLPGVTHLLGDVDEDRVFSLDGVGVQRKVASLFSYCKVCGNVMPEAGACEVCGRPRDERSLEISGNKLDKFATYKRDADDARAYRLAKWIQASNAAGQNWKRNLFRYEAVYGEKPPGRIISLAHSIVSGSTWCGACGHSVKEGSCRCKKSGTAA